MRAPAMERGASIRMTWIGAIASGGPDVATVKLPTTTDAGGNGGSDRPQANESHRGSAGRTTCAETTTTC